jgi:hypothetical protein
VATSGLMHCNKTLINHPRRRADQGRTARSPAGADVRHRKPAEAPAPNMSTTTCAALRNQ